MHAFPAGFRISFFAPVIGKAVVAAAVALGQGGAAGVADAAEAVVTFNDENAGPGQISSLHYLSVFRMVDR